jgi:hypothetical protein
MEELTQYLLQRCKNDIVEIKPVGKAELEIRLRPSVDSSNFSQNLQDHLVDHIDKFDIVKINIVDSNGVLKDSFATNQ